MTDNIANDHLKTCPSVCGAKSGPCTVNVTASHLEVPEYYIGSVPVDLKPVYNLFGIKFVCVKKDAVEYWVYFECLERVVRSLNLY